MSITQTKTRNGETNRKIEDVVLNLMSPEKIESEPMEELTNLGIEISPSLALNLTLLRKTIKNEQIAKYLPMMKTLDDYRPIAILDFLYSNYDGKEQKAVWTNVELLLQKGEQPLKDVANYALCELESNFSKQERAAPMKRLNEIVDKIINNYKTSEELEIKNRLLEKNPMIKERLEQRLDEDETKRKDLEERLSRNYVYNFAKIVGRDLKHNIGPITKKVFYYPALILGGLLPGKMSEVIYDKLGMDEDKKEFSQKLGYFIEAISVAGIAGYSLFRLGNHTSEALGMGIFGGIVGAFLRWGPVNDANDNYHGSMLTTVPYYICKGIYEIGKTAVYRIPKGTVGYFRDTAKRAKEETIKEGIEKAMPKEYKIDHKKTK